MSAELNPPPLPPERVIRYSLRATLMSITALAITIAAGGELYRNASPENQNNLLMLWAIIGLSFAFWSAWIFREPFDRRTKRQVRYVVYRTSNWSIGRKRLVRVLSIAAITAWIAFASYVIASEPVIKQDGVVSIGLCTGLAAAVACLSFIRQPIYLCEEGIPLGRRMLVPWKYVRQAEWLLHRPNVMRLHRLGGDVYLDVPLSMRDAVEAFLREKTQSVEDVASPRFEGGLGNEFCHD